MSASSGLQKFWPNYLLVNFSTSALGVIASRMASSARSLAFLPLGAVETAIVFVSFEVKAADAVAKIPHS